MDPSRPQSVIVIGGGISGLAAAYKLSQIAPQLKLTLLEAGPRVGGVLHTEYHDDWLVEHSSDSLITNVPYALDLCESLGMQDELIPTNKAERRAFVVHRGGLVPVPAGFQLLSPTKLPAIMKSPLLSFRGKLRLLAEAWVSKRTDESDESLASFTKRRFGKEAFDRLVQPLVGGIYTADPDRLSMQATMKRFVDMEREHGSLVRAALKGETKHGQDKTQGTGARYGLFVTPKNGMSSIVNRIVEQLGDGVIRTGATVIKTAERAEGGWVVELENGERLEADAVIMAARAPVAAEVLRDVSSTLSEELSGIPYAGASIALTVYPQDQLSRPLQGFGFVVPEIENRKIIAASYSHMKYPNRAPQGCAMIRTFVGGALHPEAAAQGDDEILKIVKQELGELIGVQGEPIYTKVARWDRHMPQYHVGHVQRVERIESLVAEKPGLYLAGNAYHGVGVPNCIHSGNQAAQGAAEFLQAGGAGREA